MAVEARGDQSCWHKRKKKRGEGLFKNYFDVVSCEDLKATRNEGFYLISKFFLKS